MKKLKLNQKLKLSKNVISNLDNIKGGIQVIDFPTTGCTDGCSPFASALNCTDGICTKDCA